MNLYEATYGTPRILRHRLPCSVKGLRIGFITDIHLTRYSISSVIRHVLEPLTAQRPDIVLLGGDYAEELECEKVFFEAVSSLKPPLGIYGILGNNDKERYCSNLDQIRQEAANCGITILINEEISVQTPHGPILIGGADEAKYGLPNAEGFFREGENALKILLCHYPDSAEALLDQAVLKPDLILSGHTHGGQIAPFGLTLYDFGLERIYGGHGCFFVSGEKRLAGGPLMIVSNGIGESRMPIRIGAPRQIHIIETV